MSASDLTTTIDIAGGKSGGAERWRSELLSWLSVRTGPTVSIIGRDKQLSATWMLQRERENPQGRRIASNNAGFVLGSGRRIVLLRNALHFLYPGEARSLPRLPTGIALQRPLVKLGARRADVIVVPTHAMAERVTYHCPQLRSRLFIRFHPLSAPSSSRIRGEVPFVLFPCLTSAHKDRRTHLACLVEAIELARIPLTVKVTASASDLGPLAARSAVDPIGPQTLGQMQFLWRSASAGFMPFTTESFGYPLAEARAYGVPVLAPMSNQAQEVAGGALAAYRAGDIESIAQALIESLERVVTPDPGVFDPNGYFDWLLSL